MVANIKRDSFDPEVVVKKKSTLAAPSTNTAADSMSTAVVITEVENHAPALDALNLNFSAGLASTFTQDLVLQHILKKDAIHKLYPKRKEEDEKAKLCLEEAVKAS